MALETSGGLMVVPATLALGIRQILVVQAVLHDLHWSARVVVSLLVRVLEDSTLGWDSRVVVRLLVHIRDGNILDCVAQFRLPDCCLVAVGLLVRDLDGSIPMVEPEAVAHWFRILGDRYLVAGPWGPFLGALRS